MSIVLSTELATITSYHLRHVGCRCHQSPHAVVRCEELNAVVLRQRVLRRRRRRCSLDPLSSIVIENAVQRHGLQRLTDCIDDLEEVDRRHLQYTLPRWALRGECGTLLLSMDSLKVLLPMKIKMSREFETLFSMRVWKYTCNANQDEHYMESLEPCCCQWIGLVWKYLQHK